MTKWVKETVWIEPIKLTEEEKRIKKKADNLLAVKKYYKENTEKCLARRRKYLESHKKQTAEYSLMYYKKNRESLLEKNKVWHKNHKKERNERRLSYEIETYGITQEEYNSMVLIQNGVCAICKLPPSKKRLSIDHNHETGKIRGLLCSRCNLAIGGFRDSAQLLREAANYIEKGGILDKILI
jgi:hypothetical protein